MAKRGRKPMEPTDEQRKTVERLAGYGVPIRQICHIIGVSNMTLMKHFREELDRGDAQATAKVAETLYYKAVEDRDTASCIFWLKARAGWSEKQRVEHTSPDGSMSPTVASSAVLAALKAKHAAR